MSAESFSSKARAATAAPAAASPQARSINLLCAPCRGREARVWVGPPGGVKVWGSAVERRAPPRSSGGGGGRVSTPRSVRSPESPGKRPRNWEPGAARPRASWGYGSSSGDRGGDLGTTRVAWLRSAGRRHEKGGTNPPDPAWAVTPPRCSTAPAQR